MGPIRRRARPTWAASRAESVMWFAVSSGTRTRYAVASLAMYVPCSARAGITCRGDKSRYSGEVRTRNRPLFVLAQLVARHRVRTATPVLPSVAFAASALHRSLADAHHLRAAAQCRPRFFGFRDAGEDGSSLLCLVGASSSAHKACTFPCSTSKAAVSASALSFRFSSRSSSRTRLRLSALTRGSRGANTAEARSSRASRRPRQPAHSRSRRPAPQRPVAQSVRSRARRA